MRVTKLSRTGRGHRQRGSAIVELAVLAPVFGVLLAGLAAVAVTVQAQIGLVSVAEEAALAATYAASPEQAVAFGQQRGQEVASGFALRNGSLAVGVDATGFGPGGVVRATAHYQLSANQVPLLGLAHLDLEQRHAEVVPMYRSLAGQP
jgi:Flp pilus assembly protein TadG